MLSTCFRAVEENNGSLSCMVLVGYKLKKEIKTKINEKSPNGKFSKR